jgi:hypothetical protein
MVIEQMTIEQKTGTIVPLSNRTSLVLDRYRKSFIISLSGELQDLIRFPQTKHFYLASSFFHCRKFRESRGVDRLQRQFNDRLIISYPGTIQLSFSRNSHLSALHEAQPFTGLTCLSRRF